MEEPFINVTYNGNATNDIIQSAVRKATANILSAFAEKERLDIKQLQAEGIALATGWWRFGPNHCSALVAKFASVQDIEVRIGELRWKNRKPQSLIH